MNWLGAILAIEVARTRPVAAPEGCAWMNPKSSEADRQLQERSASLTKSRKPSVKGIVIVTAVMLLVLGLAVVGGHLVVSVRSVRKTVEELDKLYPRPKRMQMWKAEAITDKIVGLGGQERAVSKLALYMRLPERVAPSKGTAVFLLAHCGEAAAPALAKAITDPDNWTRMLARKGLYELGPGARAAVPYLIDALGHSERDVRRDAAGALGSMGSSAGLAVGSLRKTLGDKDPEVRYAAATALGQIGPAARESVPELVTALKDEDTAVRSSAATALGKMKEEAKGAVPALLDALEDRAPSVRWSASDALDAIRPSPEVVLDALGRLLEDKDHFVRLSAVRALGNMGSAARNHAVRVRALLGTDNGDLRLACAIALVAMGENDKRVIHVLCRSLSISKHVHAARAALAKTGPAAIPHLVEALEGHDLIIRIEVAAIMGERRPPPQQAIAALSRCLLDEHPVLRTTAARTLGCIGPPAKDALPRLRKMMVDEGESTRVFVAWSLWRISGDGEKAIPVLTKALQSEDTDMRRETVRMLSLMGPEARPMLGALREAMKDTSPSVRRMAAEAIRNITASQE